MSFGSKTEPNDSEVGGIEAEDVATTQESMPIPYVAGTRKVAARWISDTYNSYAKEVMLERDKKGGGKGAQGSGTYDYFGSIGAAVCNGPVDSVVAVVIDGEQVWADSSKGASRENYPERYVGTIPGHGVFHFYWGTSNQQLVANSRLKANNKHEVHPDYKGTALIELRDFLFGREKVTAPNVEVVVSKGAVQSVINVSATPLDDGQINLMLPIADLLTNKRYGLGLDVSLFDATSFQEVSNKFRDRADLVYCSPLINEQTTLKACLSELESLTDSFLAWNAVSALIEAKSWPHDTSVDVEALKGVVDEDLVEVANLTAEGWSGVETGWDVSFADRERLYKESSEKFDELSLLALTGQPNRSTLKRDWITRRNQALSYAMEWGKTKSRPALEGEIITRRSSVASIAIGDLFKLDIDAEPSGTRLNQVVRMQGKTYKETGAVSCSFAAETSLIPQAYAPPITLIPDEGSFPTPDVFVRVRPFELPPLLSQTEYGTAILAQREDGLTVGYEVLYDNDNVSGEFVGIGNQRTFGVYATLDEAFPASAKGADESGYDPAIDAPVLDVSLSNMTDLLNLPDDLELVGARNDQLLLVLLEKDEVTGQVKLDENGYAILEVLSVAAITTNIDETRSVHAIRSRFATGTRSFSEGAEAWLIRKKGLSVFIHEDFKAAATDQTTIYFKTKPFNVFRSRDISEDDSVEYLFPESRFFVPRISYSRPPLGPYVGVPYVLTGTITDQDGDLSSWEIAYRGASSAEVNVAGGPVEPTNNLPFTVPITFTSKGAYKIFIRAQDSTTFVNGYVEEEIEVSAEVTESVLEHPSGLAASNNRFNSIWLTWTNPGDSTDASFSHVEIRASRTNNMTTSELVITTSAQFASYAVEDSDNRYFWIRARDVARNFSAYAQAETAGVLGKASVDVDAGVEVVTTLPETDNFDGRVVYLTTDSKLYRYVDPTGWTSAVAAADITGQLGETQIAANAVTADKILAGAVTAAKVSTNEIITVESNIRNAAITSAKIFDLSAAKLTAGEIGAAEITLGGVSSILKSSTFTSSKGWQIKGDGDAKIGSLEVRGNATVGTGADGIAIGDMNATGVQLYSADDLGLSISNLLTNGDFSDGSTGWSFDGGGAGYEDNSDPENPFWVGTPAVFSTAAGYAEITHGAPGLGGVDISLEQSFEMIVGRTYTLVFRSKADDLAVRLGTSTNFTQEVYTDADWEGHTVTLVADASTTAYISFYFDYYGTGSSLISSVDEVTVIEGVGDYSRIRLHIKRPAGGTVQGKLWFKTGSDTEWSEDKSKTFTMTTGDVEYKTYLIDMSTVSGWDGTIKQLRLDPVGNAATGTFRIGYIRVENVSGGISKAWNFVHDLDGWTANASVSDFRWQQGDVSVLQSANYVPGRSGWAIKGNGFAEFWDINVYGSVGMPYVLVGAVQIANGSNTAYLGDAGVLISAYAGTLAYYRTDGSPPTGEVGELVPVSGIVTLTTETLLTVKLFEISTGRSSDLFSATFRPNVVVTPEWSSTLAESAYRLLNVKALPDGLCYVFHQNSNDGANWGTIRGPSVIATENWITADTWTAPALYFRMQLSSNIITGKPAINNKAYRAIRYPNTGYTNNFVAISPFLV